MVIILMGVSGSGKTTIGRRLARATGWRFFEGDDYHPPANLVKMARGVPLNDADREPWLARLRSLIQQALAQDENAILASSALKRAYRDTLRVDPERVRFVYLKGDFELLKERLAARKGHFFQPELLESQFAALEEPDDSLVVDIRQPAPAVVQAIREAFSV